MFKENETFQNGRKKELAARVVTYFHHIFMGKNPDFLISKYLFLMAKVRCENFQVYTKNDDVVANPA